MAGDDALGRRRLSPADTCALADDFAVRAFGLGRHERRAARIGAEVELIPIDLETAAPNAIDGGSPRSTLAILRSIGAARGWVEERSAKASVPEMRLPSGGRITFEPGGQIEYSSPPLESASALLRDLEHAVHPIVQRALDAGVRMLSAGVDGETPVEATALQLHAERYTRMDAYFAAIGPSGRRMMRQTASCQVNLDVGDDPLARWRLVNALTPYIVAIFANSPRYAGTPTGHMSFRQHIWRTLDSSRTGYAGPGDDPVGEYLAFAMNAPTMMRCVDGEHRPFREWLADGTATVDDWTTHVSTLFPEVRPRGYLEVRSADAVPPQWYAAPIAFLGGIAYAPQAHAAASDLLDRPDLALLARAGRCALHDPAIASTARDLFEIALAGCSSLGDAFLHPSDLELAREFFDRYTRRGRSPADDLSVKPPPLPMPDPPA